MGASLIDSGICYSQRVCNDIVVHSPYYHHSSVIGSTYGGLSNDNLDSRQYLKELGPAFTG